VCCRAREQWEGEAPPLGCERKSATTAAAPTTSGLANGTVAAEEEEEEEEVEEEAGVGDVANMTRIRIQATQQSVGACAIALSAE
jgi:hypothetical protein